MPAPTSAELAVALLADLVEALGHAHTEVTLVPALAGALGKHLALRWVEVGRCGVGAEEAHVATLRAGATTASLATRRLRGTLAAQALGGAPRLLHIARLDPEGARAPEAHRARAAKAESLALLPLPGAEGALGYALLALGPARGPAPALGPALLGAMARVIATALAQLTLLGRVADVSRRALQESRQLRGELTRVILPPEVIAASPAMRAIVHTIVPLVARQDTTVLLRGETGTGKEVIARRIHALSPRAARPFLEINCGALPESLVESALFGHERGAFTGAMARRLGVFERAHGGTLLLDEVAELPRAVQVKLLRALQEGEIERVGGEATIPVDVRVIAATHRPLEAMVRSGAFREDLYYRLQVFPIELPPLRERPEDLAPLVRALVHRIAARFGSAPPRVSEAALARLATHAWPGNIRELANVLERSMITSPPGELRIARAFADPGARVSPTATTAHDAGAIVSYREAAIRCIEAALAARGGRLYGDDGAAAALGLKPTTLQSKMKKLGIKRADPSRG